MPRFYAPPAHWSDALIFLDEAESRHAVEVLRLRVGDALTVFDGFGRQAEARVFNASKRQVVAEVLQQFVTPEPVTRTCLIQALPKGKLFEWILEKATELSATSIQPLLTERTVVQLEGAERARKHEKWQRTVIEACKQCGQNWLPEVRPPLSLTELLRTPGNGTALVASLYPSALSLRKELEAGLSPQMSVFVGPEGDFTQSEMERIVAWGAHPVTLGEVVLRVETAAMYCLSVLAHYR